MTDNAIEINHVSKSYTLYSSHASMAFDWCGLYRLRFWKKRPEFPIKKALNDVSITIEKGKRYGLIGRNGAGKTTLLKAIAGLVEPSSGNIITSGSIQSLMQVGGEGFHPEFTGRENVRFSLLYKGLRGDELEKAYNDAVEFAELGEFIDQPIKTYSLGMQSRLKFATATTVKPDILLIDEILGAGDAYFSTKSIERMRKLTNEGCTLVLVSHSKSQILDFCSEGIWLEDGAVRMTGDVRQVMDAYEQATYNARNLQTKSPETPGLLDAPQSMKRPFLLQAIENDFPNISWKDSTIGGFMREGYPSPKAEVIDLEIHSVTPLKNGKTCNWAETGESFSFQMELKNNSSEQKQVHLTTIFYGHNGDRIAADESPILTLPAGQMITVVQDFSPLQLGHRDYMACISLNENNQVQHTLYGMYIKVNETNDTDPPLLHYSAKWYLNESLSSQDSRISGFI